MPMIFHAYNIIIDHGLGAPGHISNFINDLNDSLIFSINVNGQSELDWTNRSSAVFSSYVPRCHAQIMRWRGLEQECPNPGSNLRQGITQT